MKTVIATLLPLMLAIAAVPAAGGLQEDLLALDKAQWNAWAKKDGAVFRKLLTEDHIQIVAGVPPVIGREAVAKGAEGLSCELKSFDFRDAKLRQLTPDVAVLSYTATQDSSCDGVKLPPKLQVTSVWVKQKGGQWLSANYQETAIE
jgi:uncharacterized protein (TIGR02246 family)